MVTCAGLFNRRRHATRIMGTNYGLFAQCGNSKNVISDMDVILYFHFFVWDQPKVSLSSAFFPPQCNFGLK